MEVMEVKASRVKVMVSLCEIMVKRAGKFTIFIVMGK